MDCRTIEIIGRNYLVNDLVTAGLEVALSLRDRGIDMIAYLDLAAHNANFVAYPIQMKGASTRSFSIDRKYQKISNLLIAYVWGLQAQEHAQCFALTYDEALGVATEMGYTRAASWTHAGAYATTSPSVRLCKLLTSYQMSPEGWKRKILAVSHRSGGRNGRVVERR